MSGSGETLGRLAQAINERDWDGARSLLTDDVEFVDVAAGVSTQGVEAFFGYVQVWTGAFSNMALEVRSLVGDEQHAAAEIVGGGTHDGPLMTPGGEVPATGRDFREPFVWFADMADGKVARLGDYYNAMSVMAQLGLTPEPAAS